MSPRNPAAALVPAWMATAGISVLASWLAPWLGVAVPIIAAAATIGVFRGAFAERLAAAAFVLTAALAPVFPEGTWLFAGVVGGLALTFRPRSRRTVEDLQRHLSWCRRRGEDAAVVVMRVPADAAATSEDVREVMRLTDSVHVEDGFGGYHLTAVVDEADLSRTGLEQRVREQLGDGVEFGWASFPRDGLTLSVLVEVATSGTARPAPRAAVHADSIQSAGVPR
jgi:hypothetical protein